MDDTKFTLLILVECGQVCPSPSLRTSAGCPDCLHLKRFRDEVLNAELRRLIGGLRECGYKILVGESPELHYRQWVCYRTKFSLSEES